MTLVHLFLVHRYKISSVHYVSPTDDNRYQAQKMKAHGLFSDVHDEVGQIIAADVSADGVKALLAPDRALGRFDSAEVSVVVRPRSGSGCGAARGAGRWLRGQGARAAKVLSVR